MRNQIASIRPAILTIKKKKLSGEKELFQNQTLRPILKFQNDLILSIFLFHFEKHKTEFYQFTEAKRNEFIEQKIQLDRNLRFLLLGTIIGHFTDLEWQMYIPNEKEMNRRITRLLIQRLQDQL
ncbi:MAG: hypothetical protein P8M34_02685 [Saprospiraceae bacterium]|nr:hypothetical protein [Saprospiraceae bacterium]|tara:strand:- start:46 stop:417 length:372 start_codon:yes stop_codon:yes gene_type:complete